MSNKLDVYKRRVERITVSVAEVLQRLADCKEYIKLFG